MGRTSDARERLIEAALRLVWRDSYGAVGVNAICAEAGVKKGSFYHFFPTKAELVATALEEAADEAQAELDRLFSPTRPPLERLAAWYDQIEARQVALRAEHGKVLGCPQTSIGCELSTQDPEVAVRIRRLLGRYGAYLTSAVRDAQAEGRVAAGADPQQLAQHLLTFLEGVMVEARIHDDPRVADKLKAGARALLGLTQPALLA